MNIAIVNTAGFFFYMLPVALVCFIVGKAYSGAKDYFRLAVKLILYAPEREVMINTGMQYPKFAPVPTI